MKSIIKTLPLSIASFCMMTCFLSCTSEEEPTVTEKQQNVGPVFAVPTCLWPDSTEKPLFDLSNHPKPEAEGNFEISEFNMNSIYAVNGSSLPFKTNVILNEHFCALKDTAYKIRQNSVKPDSSVGALRIRLGLNARKDSIVMVYQPVALINPTVSVDTISFTVDEGTNPQYYRHTPSGFSAISNTTACKDYTLYIQLKHKQSETPSKFRLGKDVESVLFSFQEIGQLIDDNQTNYVSVWNAFAKKPGTTSNDSICYHSILLGPDSLNGPSKFFGPFPNKFANLAHLCPPSCEKVAFRIKHK